MTPRGDATNVAPDETVLPGERSHLIARSPKHAVRYRNRPNATAGLLRDGWLYTGDVAIQDPDTRQYVLVDRMDNRIITGGENVYPQEVERYWHEDQTAVADFKRPREVHFVDVVSRSNSGKVDRDALRKRTANPSEKHN